MPKRNKRQRPAPRRYLHGLFAQPPQTFYARTSMYQCGREMEIENFRTILEYEDGRLRVDLGGGVLTVLGDGLTIVSLEKRRILLHGTFLKTEYSYD